MYSRYDNSGADESRVRIPNNYHGNAFPPREHENERMHEEHAHTQTAEDCPLPPHNPEPPAHDKKGHSPETLLGMSIDDLILIGLVLLLSSGERDDILLIIALLLLFF